MMGGGTGGLELQTRICTECGGELVDVWLTLGKKKYCSDCWAKMKNPPKLKCYTPDTTPKKWRGIKTNPTTKNEHELVTITNRFEQKSVTLRRIDDQKRFAGYPGNTGISKKLAKLIPFCSKYVEPFAGTAKVFQELTKLWDGQGYPDKFVLNDKSKLVTDWLKKEFRNTDVSITTGDFRKCVLKHDSTDTVFLFDQPWFPSFYDQVFSCLDRTIKEYDEDVLDLCRNLRGKFFITTRRENTRMRKSGFTNFFIQSEYVVMGKYPQVLITTNIPKEDLE